jgi:hypothetical protein
VEQSKASRDRPRPNLCDQVVKRSPDRPRLALGDGTRAIAAWMTIQARLSLSNALDLESIGMSLPPEPRNLADRSAAALAS